MNIGLGCVSSQNQTLVMKIIITSGVSSAFRGELGQRSHDAQGLHRILIDGLLNKMLSASV
jgi:hypothetical protein